MPDIEKVILNQEKFPSNSINKKPVKPKAKRVTTAKRIKKPFYKRFANAFLDGEPAHEVGDYVLHDVIIPAAKSTIADLIEGAIDLLLFGGAGRAGRQRSPYVTRDRGRSYVPYNSMHERSAGLPNGRGQSARVPGEDRSRARGVDVSDIVFATRSEAESVLGELADTINKYGSTTVSDFFDMAGVSSAYTDQKWGWVDLVDANVIRVREGWIIELPRPTVVD